MKHRKDGEKMERKRIMKIVDLVKMLEDAKVTDAEKVKEIKHAVYDDRIITLEDGAELVFGYGLEKAVRTK